MITKCHLHVILQMASGSKRMGLPDEALAKSGGPEDRFLKHLSDNVFADLELLYTRMVDLGVEYRDVEVYLEDLDGKP